MLYETRNPHGGDLYETPVRLDFSANINPFGTPESVMEAVRESVGSLRNYPDPNCRALVSAIAEFEGVSKEYVLCGGGAAELIFAFAGAVKPQNALVLAPGFCEYETALRSFGAQVHYHYLKEENDFRLGWDFPEVLRSFSGDALILCTPNNPTGLTIEEKLLTEILTICHEKKVPLLLDECFLDLTDGRGLSRKGELEKYPELTILKAFTKSYGMAGLRLGYCLSANGKLLSSMSAQSQPWNVSTPAQLAGVAALKEQAFVERARALIAAERLKVKGALEKLGLRVIPSETNYLLFKAELGLKEKLLEKGILIRSCGNYPGLDGTWYRIAVKLPEENAQLLTALEEIIHG